jgi:hypothetical protein
VCGHHHKRHRWADQDAAEPYHDCGCDDFRESAASATPIAQPEADPVDGPRIRTATIRICQPCLDLEGQECHTPECVFCFRSVTEAKWLMDKMLIAPIIDGERFVLVDTDEPDGQWRCGLPGCVTPFIHTHNAETFAAHNVQPTSLPSTTSTSAAVEAAREIADAYYFNNADTKANWAGREQEVYDDIAAIISRYTARQPEVIRELEVKLDQTEELLRQNKAIADAEIERLKGEVE